MIDTLKASQQLRENGFDDNQAHSIINVVLSNNEQLATKIDIESVKLDIQGVKQDVQHVKRDIQSLRWLVGISLLLNTLAISGIIAILISLINLN